VGKLTVNAILVLVLSICAVACELLNSTKQLEIAVDRNRQRTLQSIKFFSAFSKFGMELHPAVQSLLNA